MNWPDEMAVPPCDQLIDGKGLPNPRHPRVTPEPSPTCQTLPPPTATGAYVGDGEGKAVSRGDGLLSPAAVVAVTHT